LEVDPVENRTLMLMMELLVQDFPYSSIVSDLNSMKRAFACRKRQALARVTVFKMMPRLIEVVPRLFETEEWQRCDKVFAFRDSPEVFRQRGESPD